MTYKTIIINPKKEKNFTGYLATPSHEKGTGIVLIQEIFGVNASIRGVADRLAAEGYIVLAPDLFWRIKPGIELGYGTDDMGEAFDYYHRFNVEEGLTDLIQTVDTLRAHPACNGKVATWGFCLGGKLSYLTAAHHTPDAAIAFYGGGIAEQLHIAHQIHCPLLMHFGEKDEMIPHDQVEAIQKAFSNCNNVDIYTYKNVGHAFYNQDRSSYDSHAAELAHRRSIQFLQHYL